MPGRMPVEIEEAIIERKYMVFESTTQSNAADFVNDPISYVTERGALRYTKGELKDKGPGYYSQVFLMNSERGGPVMVRLGEKVREFCDSPESRTIDVAGTPAGIEDTLERLGFIPLTRVYPLSSAR